MVLALPVFHNSNSAILVPFFQAHCCIWPSPATSIGADKSMTKIFK
uniref:Uncharacterized protein n=1 Tax=Boechera stricta TaxID=72658 RepID=Q1L0Q1_BOEST|nr:unknown protein [Boechera stricta]